MLTRLLEHQTFKNRVRGLLFDEAHFIVTAGKPDTEGNVFRPEYAKGYEIRIRLNSDTSTMVFSATMPPDILKQIMASLRIPSEPSRTSLLTLTTNRPNLTFAIKKASGTLSNLAELDFLIPKAHHPPMSRSRKTLIFVPTTKLTMAVSQYLNTKLPGIAQRIHSTLSTEFKHQIIEEFHKKDGRFSILVATTVLSNVRVRMPFDLLY